MKLKETIYIGALTAAALVLSACSSTNDDSLNATQRAQLKYLTDSAYCEMEASKGYGAASGAGNVGYAGFFSMANSQLTFNRVYNSCMKFKGYQNMKHFGIPVERDKE